MEKRELQAEFARDEVDDGENAGDQERPKASGIVWRGLIQNYLPLLATFKFQLIPFIR